MKRILPIIDDTVGELVGTELHVQLTLLLLKRTLRNDDSADSNGSGFTRL